MRDSIHAARWRALIRHKYFAILTMANPSNSSASVRQHLRPLGQATDGMVKARSQMDHYPSLCMAYRVARFEFRQLCRTRYYGAITNS